MVVIEIVDGVAKEVVVEPEKESKKEESTEIELPPWARMILGIVEKKFRDEVLGEDDDQI